VVSAVLLECDEMGELVTKRFFEDVRWAVNEACGESDESALGITAAQATGHPRAELDGKPAYEVVGLPQSEPFIGLLEGPGGQHGLRIVHGNVRGSITFHGEEGNPRLVTLLSMLDTRELRLSVTTMEAS
jgi:hypothetical protein